MSSRRSRSGVRSVLFTSTNDTDSSKDRNSSPKYHSRKSKHHSSTSSSPSFKSTASDAPDTSFASLESSSSDDAFYNSSSSYPSDRTDTIKINMTKLKNQIVDFRSYADVPVKQLTESLKKDLHNLAEIITTVRGTRPHKYIVDTINETFENVDTAQPGTVAAFFRGCFISDKFKGNPACSAVCAGSIPPADEDWEFCNQNVLFFDGVTLTIKHQSTEDRSSAIIHITDAEAYHGFTEEHIRQLQARGIETVTLHIYYSGDYTTISNATPVCKLPLVGDETESQVTMVDEEDTTEEVIIEPESPPKAPKKKQRRKYKHNYDEYETEWGWVAWIIIIIVIIIFLLLIWLAWKRMNNESSYEQITTSSVSASVSEVDSSWKPSAGVSPSTTLPSTSSGKHFNI